MSKGISSLCGVVHERMGCSVKNGDVFIFIGSSRKLMKLLHAEDGGLVMYVERLEAGILRILARNKNQVVRRSVIISHNWDTKDDEDSYISRSLDVYLVKLRKKLVADPNVSIKTVKGVGFMLVEE